MTARRIVGLVIKAWKVPISSVKNRDTRSRSPQPDKTTYGSGVALEDGPASAEGVDVNEGTAVVAVGATVGGGTAVVATGTTVGGGAALVAVGGIGVGETGVWLAAGVLLGWVVAVRTAVEIGTLVDVT